MNNGEGTEKPPSRWRIILATLFVGLIVFGAWKFIEYRMQPPPPPMAEIHKPELETPSKDQIPK